MKLYFRYRYIVDLLGNCTDSLYNLFSNFLNNHPLSVLPSIHLHIILVQRSFEWISLNMQFILRSLCESFFLASMCETGCIANATNLQMHHGWHCAAEAIKPLSHTKAGLPHCGPRFAGPIWPIGEIIYQEFTYDRRIESERNDGCETDPSDVHMKAWFTALFFFATQAKCQMLFKKTLSINSSYYS